ncbi:MAG: hypothetical protein KDK09_01020 [Rhodobacteraceae bacterium]|nr:hypothetical protein [Paracoccaceae bacterium]
MRILTTVAGITAALLAAGSATAQEPQHGGQLVVGVVQGDPDTFDCHATRSIGSLYRLAPHYSTLLRYSSVNYPAIEGDVADSWEVSADGLVYTFHIRPGVVFHDGSSLDAHDVEASLNRVRNPPAGVVSARQAQFSAVASIEATDDQTVVVQLSHPDSAMLDILAGPFNCIYSAELLESDADYPARRVMGSGPFVFSDYQAGASWTGTRFDGYYDPGKPYLDSVQLLNMAMPAAVNAMAAGQIGTIVPSLSQADVDRIAQMQGDNVVAYPAIDTTVFFNAIMNTQRAPFDDVRVRRALNLAIDRRAGAAALSRTTSASGYGGWMRPGSEWERPQAELEQLPGFNPDIEAARAEARALLAEAGQENLSFTYLNWNRYTPMGVFLIDQWRQIGVTVTQETLDVGEFFGRQNRGDFDVTLIAIAEYSDDPTLRFSSMLSHSQNPRNLTFADDPAFDALFQAQAIETDPAARRDLALQIENEIMDQALYIPLFWSVRPMVVRADVHGFEVPNIASNYVGLDFGSVWLSQ